MTTQAWYLDSSEEFLHEPHLTQPPHYLTTQQVLDRSGVRLTKIENCDNEEKQARIQQEGGFRYYDWLEISRDAMPDFDERLKKFHTEHLHEDDEIRLITAGSGFFEIRDFQDRWIRLHLTKGDLIHLPAGIYHRLTLDSSNYVKMLRLFTEQPQWKAVNRPEGDKTPAREAYLHSVPALRQ
ncbi:acireductone dioxygenase-like [Babylonia areolata]|uniref:acireductone dioxygenase-like n=1 Tax=Babylonia areolata TaxID=304850 RepID=UPI003FCFB96D